MLIGSKAFNCLWKEWQEEHQPFASTSVIAGLYRDARRPIWGT